MESDAESLQGLNVRLERVEKMINRVIHTNQEMMNLITDRKREHKVQEKEILVANNKILKLEDEVKALKLSVSKLTTN